jgi:multidrug resistance efflux pump
MRSNMNTTLDHRNGHIETGVNALNDNGHLAPELPAAPQRQESEGGGTLLNATTTGAAKKALPRALAAIAAAAVVAGTAVYYTRCVLPFESTDDAFVEGHVTAIASQVPGRVSQLFVEDNQDIKKGDLLLQMDPRDYEARLAQAQANLTAARSQSCHTERKTSPS